jgi:hypothetical protein
MLQRKNFLPIILLILSLLTSGKINAKTCCTRHVTVDISGSAVEASLAMAMWVNLFSSEGGSSLPQCPVLIVGPGGCIDYQFKGVLFSGPVGKLDMKLIDCVHNTVVKEASITWPCVSFPNSCIEIMMNFIAPFAAYFQPLDKIIFDYERIPERCEIGVEQEEVSPGQEIQAELSDIVDSEGQKSREFNRIVVYASKGEILGGTELDSDPKFKAFRVGDGSIVFTYKAPDTEDNPGNADDTIFVCNSCDIRSESFSSMSSTELRDKIAEKTIKMVKADAEATLTAKCHAADSNMSIDWEFTFKATFQYHDTIADEETYQENYDVKSYSLSDVRGTIIDKTDGSKAEAHQGEIDDTHLPDSMWIEFDTKTGKAKEVNLPGLGFNLIFTNGSKMLQTFGNAFPGMSDVKTGDGVHELGGGGSYSINGVTFSCKWSVQRHRR